MKELSLVQAYEILRLHLSEPGGLLDQLEHGAEVDNEYVHMLDHAIEKIHQEWKNVSIVPKDIINLFNNIFYRLTSIISTYPQREAEIHTLYYQFIPWMDSIFAEEPLSEEAAIAIVVQQIFGLEPLSLELRFGHTINEGSLELFLDALDALSIMWKSKEQISKLAAGALLNAQAMFADLEISSFDPKQQNIRASGEQVRARIDACLR